MNKGRSNKKLRRRSFIKSLGAITAAGITGGRSTIEALAQQRTQSNHVTQEALHAAEQVIGVELTSDQETMALAGVNRNFSAYEGLRKITIPLDTEPAIAFHPGSRSRQTPRSQETPKHAPKRVRKVEVPHHRSVDDLAFCTVAQLAELVRTRRVSPVDLTRMYIDRLKRYGPKLNCTITLTEDLALKQAAQAEREIKRGKHRGPLHGIPWGAKDLFATKGIPTTWGAEPFRNQVIDYDATVVNRLHEAGAVLVAKLSMGALAQGPRWFGGVTRNPWQPDEDRQGSSGSSAGPASATSAGLVGFSIGTETLGSIVSPSARCGVVGLRSTYGRISRYGAMALSWTMDKIGPICRGVEDCALVLKAVYGVDGHDTTVENIPFNWNPHHPIASMRIAYLKNEFEQGNDERKKMYAAALDALRGAGAKLEPLELPQFNTQNLRIILSAEAAAAFDDITRSGAVNQLAGQDAGDWPNVFRTSRFVPAVEYLRAQRARALLMDEMDKLMSRWDVFVSPAPNSASLVITNLTGHPAVCVPCGMQGELPQSIMFTSGLYDEESALRAAFEFERVTRWHGMHPKVDWS